MNGATRPEKSHSTDVIKEDIKRVVMTRRSRKQIWGEMIYGGE